MRNYRVGFWAAVAANLVLLTVAMALWSRAHAPQSASPVSPASAPPSAPSAAAEPTEPPLTSVQLSPERLQSIGVSSGEVVRRPVADEIRTTGNVAVDETRLAYVQVRFPGYLQRVFVDATYQYVRKGQPLFTIYSPDVVSTEREYLLARQSQARLERVADPEVARDTASLVEAAAARLRQWNVPRREIARLESTGDVRPELEIDSPVSGYVIEREALPNKYAQPDTRLYTLADLSTIWVLAQVYQSDLGRLKRGDPAKLTVDTYPGRTFSGHVDFIYPDVDLATRTARVRLQFPNPALELTPGMYVNVALSVAMGEHEVIPASGVLHTGTRQIVFVDHGGGRLEPREVQLGARAGDDYVVLKGVTVGDRIVTSANFLIDSESQLQAALGSFEPPQPGAGASTARNTSPQGHIEFATDPNPPQKGRNRLRVKLTGADGAPAAGAEVTATFFMTAMPAMGMSAMRISVPLADRGDGVYEGVGELQSGGTWQVTIVARKSDQVLASQQVSVSATGGM
jgi:Cu(I)/Ag(I) efflux system membrane fusion protein/cobalt-zinc-cadmium efflux system membrane fusion protein